MRNFNATRRPPGQPYSGVPQSLPLALSAEFEARAFYRRMSEAYGAKAPFPALLAAAEKRVGWLTAAARKHGVACPLDSAGAQISSSWLDNCRRAANGEAALVRLYQHLLPHAGWPAVAALFAKLLRQSVDRQLPALLRAISAANEQERFHAAHGVPPEEAYLKHGLVSTILEKAFSVLGADHRAIGLFSPVLRSTHPALLAGMAVAGAMVFSLKKNSPSHRKEG